jgi:hypothetical protein
MSATVFFADPANEIATLTNTFSVLGVPTDPTVTTLTITDPTGAITTPAVTHVSTGKFSATVACTIAGLWLYKWTGTGAAQDTAEGTFTVSAIDNSFYCSVEELKSRLGVTGTGDDLELTFAVQAASRSVDEICGRYFWRGTDTRTYVPQSIWEQSLDDLVSVTTLKIDRDGDGTFEETWTLNTDYALTPYNTGSTGELRPYTGMRITGTKFLPFTWMWSHLDRIQVTGVFGWPSVPLAVKQASLIAAADLFKLKDAPFGVAGISDFGVMRVKANPIVPALLARYMSGQRVGV